MRQCTALVAILLVACICKAQDRFATQVVLPEECQVPLSPIYGNEIVAHDGVLCVSVQSAFRDGESIPGLVEIHERDDHGFYHKVDEIRYDPTYGEVALYGGDIDFDGERLVIGIRGTTGGTASAVHVMRREGPGTWILEARVTAPAHPEFTFSTSFGDAIAIDGDALVISDRGARTVPSSENAGALLIYRFDGASWSLDLVDTAPYQDAPRNFQAVAVDGRHAVATIQSDFPLKNGFRVYDLLAGTTQEIRYSEALCTSIDIHSGLIAARADRGLATPGECGKIYTFEQSASGLFEEADVIEHACNVGFPSSSEDQGRRIVIREDRIVVNGRIDWEGGRYGTMLGSFDLFERTNGVWSRSDQLHHCLSGTYAYWPSGKVGGLAMDGDSVILGHQWSGRDRVTSCGDGPARGALSVYDTSDTYCRADIDGDQALTVFDFLAFANAFDDRNPVADFEWDGYFTLSDYLEFLNQFDAGCP